MCAQLPSSLSTVFGAGTKCELLANGFVLVSAVFCGTQGIDKIVALFGAQEIAQFQNRLNRNMQECQERARDSITPGMDSVPKKVEEELIRCMGKQVNEHIKLLKPMKDRITAALSNYK